MRQIATNANNNVSGDAETDYTLGIYQSIGMKSVSFFPFLTRYITGYKEFHDYLSAPKPSETMFDAAVEHMKLSTRQYAKRQVSWIRNKLLPAVYTANAKESLVPAYLLDATGKNTPLIHLCILIKLYFQVLGEDWNKNVRDLGIRLAEGIFICPLWIYGLTRLAPVTDFLAERDLPDPLTLSDDAKRMMSIKEKFAE